MSAREPDTDTDECPQGPLPTAWQDAIAAYRNAGLRLGIVLEGETRFTAAWQARLRAVMPAGSVVLNTATDNAWAMRLLGDDINGLVIDASTRLDPDLLGLAVGALRGGGLLVLRLRPADGPGDVPGSSDETGRFARRLRHLLDEHPGVGLITARRQRLPVAPAVTAPPPVPNGRHGARGEEQAEAVRRILALADRHDTCTLVLRAERGRGKSAALGIAAAHWLHQRSSARLLLVASRATALHAARSAFGDASGDHRRLEQLPVEQAIRRQPVVDAVFIDEAAAIPPQRLQRLLRPHRRAVLASTAAGYEGSGRGLDTSLAQWLDRHRPGWTRIDLQRPLRWSQPDPMEGFLADALAPSAPRPLPVAAATRRITRVDRDRLVEDEKLLGQIFSLLSEAHYRTRPSDLRLWLDAPELALWTLHEGEALSAVAVTIDEGGLPPATVTEVVAGRERVRGHQLAQSLAAHCGLGVALAGRGVRILRLAVRGDRRRRGLGDTLTGAVAEAAARAGRDWLGASFGADPPLVAFWRHAGMLPMRFGQRADRMTGRRAILMIAGLSRRGRALAAIGVARLQRDLPWLVADPDFRVDQAVVDAALPGDMTPAPASRHEDAFRARVFAEGRCAFLTARPALCRIVREAPIAPPLLERRCRHNDTWAEIRRDFGLHGNRSASAAMRRAVAEILQGPPANSDPF